MTIILVMMVMVMVMKVVMMMMIIVIWGILIMVIMSNAHRASEDQLYTEGRGDELEV